MTGADDVHSLLSPVQDKFDELLALVDKAGQEIMQVYESAQPAAVSLKSDNSPVTEADTRANTILMAGLHDAFPDLPVVSEEAAGSLSGRSPEGAFWLVDPLDGTREFIKRTDQFTVNIALVLGGRPIMGIVTAPALGEAYWGFVTTGAFERRGGQQHAISAARFPARDESGEFDRAVRILASQSHSSAETQSWIDRLNPHELQQAGSSLKFCHLANGRADCYPRLTPTCEWDTAAGQAVLESAGGRVLTLDGKPLSYGSDTELNPQFIALGADCPWPLV
ncbi:MAG: 3'(2'),5'-bisphosphate nucleotidase CysQ [Burkholderiaceae bacterium]